MISSGCFPAMGILENYLVPGEDWVVYTGQRCV